VVKVCVETERSESRTDESMFCMSERRHSKKSREGLGLGLGLARGYTTLTLTPPNANPPPPPPQPPPPPPPAPPPPHHPPPAAPPPPPHTHPHPFRMVGLSRKHTRIALCLSITNKYVDIVCACASVRVALRCFCEHAGKRVTMVKVCVETERSESGTDESMFCMSDSRPVMKKERGRFWPVHDVRLLRGCCARINHPFTSPAHLNFPPWCNTIARLLNSIRRPFGASG